MKKIHFTDQYKINKSNPVEFFDIQLSSDLEAFIDPFLIANYKDIKLNRAIYRRTVNFMENLNREYIQPNDRKNGLMFLFHLHEPNEYYLGYSPVNKGKAIARTKSEIIFDSLRRNQFAKKGVTITNEAHNVLLLVKGIGQDNISDIIANVCRDLFAEYTLKVCNKYGVQTIKTKVEYYDSASHTWKEKDAKLPEYTGKKIILIPKGIVSGKRMYSNHYNWFISSNYLSAQILNGKRTEGVNKKMTTTLSDGTKKAVIKEIFKVFRKPKDDLIKFVLEFKGSLDAFLKYAKENYPEVDLSKFFK